MNRAYLKMNAKLLLRQSYWRTVLAALIAGLLVTSSASTPVSGFSIPMEEDWQDIVPAYGTEELRMLLLVLGCIFAVTLVVVIFYNIFLSSVLEVGTARFFLRCRMEKNPPIKEMFFGFRRWYLNIVKAVFFRDLYTFLWSLLFLVPGIIRRYRWLLLPYILAENPDMPPREARDLSARLMDGHKMEAFVLGLSFFGWTMLSIMTMGVLGVFFVNPYMHLTYAEYYSTLRAEAARMLPFAPPRTAEGEEGVPYRIEEQGTDGDGTP